VLVASGVLQTPRTLLAADIPTITLANISDAGTAASHPATDFDTSGAAASAQSAAIAASCQRASNLSDLANAGTARTNLGLGALATKSTVGTTDIDADAVTYAKIQNVSATDKVLGRSTAGAGDVEEITCTAAGRALIDDADAAAQRTTLGLGSAATQASTAFDATGAAATAQSAAIAASCQRASNLSDVASASTARTNLGLGTLATANYPSLTTAEAFATATTSVSAATYADITGCSITLAAGTWLILAYANFSSVNAAAMLHLAITDNANAVVAEGSQGVPASGTTNVAQLGNVGLSAIVSPGASTTYKLRGARGNTTLTGTVVVMDGAGTGTSNNLTDNTDKGTSIRAVRIA
jgi:hypothetical protein